MTALPPALKPWEEQLSAFPEDLALSLGAWVQRIALGVGPLRARTSEGLSEPDGYDGLARRGPYERLLASEWALATELPEEFTRKAAMREHSFLKLSYREPGGSKRSVALFDTGPGQLGTPRIAHLAALIVMAKRARDAGAFFSWGFLQHTDDGLIREVTPASVRRLLHARTAAEVVPEDLQFWGDLLGPRLPDDVWLIGSQRLLKLAAGLKVSTVVARDVLEPGKRQVSLGIRSRAREVPLVLELPEPAQCTRLLRDPFAAVTAASQVTGTAKAKRVLYSANGRRLLTVLEDGTVAGHAIPNSPRAGVGKPRRFSPPRGERVVAVGWHARLLTFTWHEEKGLTLHGLEPKPVEVARVGEVYQPPSADAPVGACHLMWRAQNPAIAFMDGAGKLFSLNARRPSQLEVVASGVRAFASAHTRLVYLEESDRAVEGERLRLVVEKDGRQRRTPLGADELMQAHVAPHVAAVHLGEMRWVLVSDQGLAPRLVPEHLAVVGVLSNSRWGRDGLVVLEPDRRTLTLLLESGARKLVTAPADIVQASVNPDWPEVVYVTARGGVEVYSLMHDGLVLRLTPGSPPAGKVEGGPP